MSGKDQGLPPLGESVAGWPIEEPLEGVHYYWDGELLVFTEAYHRARGTCCGSRCRHCPYDHVAVP